MSLDIDIPFTIDDERYDALREATQPSEVLAFELANRVPEVIEIKKEINIRLGKLFNLYMTTMKYVKNKDGLYALEYNVTVTDYDNIQILKDEIDKLLNKLLDEYWIRYFYIEDIEDEIFFRYINGLFFQELDYKSNVENITDMEINEEEINKNEVFEYYEKGLNILCMFKKIEIPEATDAVDFYKKTKVKCKNYLLEYLHYKANKIMQESGAIPSDEIMFTEKQCKQKRLSSWIFKDKLSVLNNFAEARRLIKKEELYTTPNNQDNFLKFLIHL